jgi:hypothetical protein
MVASITALADGVTEMMYLAFAPRSMADVGTIVELSEKIVSSATAIRRTRWDNFLFIGYSPYGDRIFPISR